MRLGSADRYAISNKPSVEPIQAKISETHDRTNATGKPESKAQKRVISIMVRRMVIPSPVK